MFAIAVACGGEDGDAVAAPTAMPATQSTVAPTTRAPAANPVAETTPTPVPVATAMPAATTPAALAKIQRVSMANPPPLTENNRIWSAAWSILLQHDPYGETLLDNDSVTSEPTLQLAESWEMSNGFKTWTFKLKEGVPWHFGWGEFTSADVAHTHALHVQEEALGNFKTLWESGSPTIIGPYEIRFDFDPPMIDGLRLFSRLAGDFVIQSKAQWDDAGGALSAYDEQPAGTGSYQYGGRRLGENIWYEKVDDHWNGENPDFEELAWVWGSEQLVLPISTVLAYPMERKDNTPAPGSPSTIIAPPSIASSSFFSLSQHDLSSF